MSRSLFIVQAVHLRNGVIARGLANFEQLVCNPSIPVDELRAVAPQATLLAYFDATTIPSYGGDEGMFGSLRTALMEHRLVDANGESVKNSYGNYELQLTFDAYATYATWLKSEPNVMAFDGLYLDQMWGVPPEPWLQATRREQYETRLRWSVLTDYWCDLLRPGWDLLIGNVGAEPGEAPEELDAITIEKSHLERMGNLVAMAHFLGRRRKEHNVAWFSTMEVEGLVMKGEQIL